MTQALNLELLAYLDSVSGVSYEHALRAYKEEVKFALDIMQSNLIVSAA